MALTRIDSYLVDLDSLGGITFDNQAGVPTLKVDAVNHRVGIGTTNPTVPVHIFRSTSGTALKLNAGAGGGGTFVDLDFDTYLTSQAGYANAVASIRVIDDGFYSGHITFRTKGASIGASQSEVVRITSAGNVGIGTTDPSQKLDIMGGLYIQEGQHRLRVSNKFYEAYPIVHLHADNGNPAKTILTVDAWAGIYSTVLITIEVWSSHSISGIATYARGGAVAHYNGTRSISALTAVTSFGGLGVGTIAWTGPSTAGSTGFSLTYTGPASNYTISHLKITANSFDGVGISISNDYN